MEQAERKTESLSARLSELLRERIVSGAVKPGDKLPSEAELTRVHSVSRTVVREAMAALRIEGLVEARRGSGVYALDRGPVSDGQSLTGLTTGRITGVIELLEIRGAVEVRAAGLAAMRRSNANIDTILDANNVVAEFYRKNEPTREADYRFHYAIAEATQNTFFPQFLNLIRTGMVPRQDLGKSLAGHVYTRNPALLQEHRQIVEAIIYQDAAAAETAMEQHLEGNLARYRALLRDTITTE